MEIFALGHAGFRLKSKDVTVVIDPPSPSFGYPVKGVSANIVCVTHDHPGHNNTQAIGGSPYVVHGPGEYEVSGVLITGMRAFHDDKRGEERGGNTIYLLHLEDLLICHLGDLGHTLSAAQQEEASGADILMIPVGGQGTLDAAKAVEIIAEIEPSIVIPMHYATPAFAGSQVGKHKPPLDTVEAFCHAMGVPLTDPQTKLQVTRASVPTERQVVILSPRG